MGQRISLEDVNGVKMEVYKYGLAVLFLAAGFGKIAGSEYLTTAFENYGYPLSLMYLVGVCEIAAASGLFTQKTRFLSAGAICVVMFGAAATHLFYGEIGMFVFTVIVFSISLSLARHYIGDTEFEIAGSDQSSYVDVEERGATLESPSKKAA